ncbi:MAG: DUF3300 domain-containing protein [Rhodopila sp.]
MIVRPVRALVVCLMLHASWIAVPHAQPAPPATAQQADAATTFNTEQLDALLAPIALYPDTLLTQVLMASTFPLQVVEAARWVEVPANKSLSGDALTKALEVETWDPSVKSLVPFPSALAMMNGNLDWMQQLGYAFADQQAQVLDSVQRLRRQAQANGNLQSTPQQTVRVVEQPQQARSVQETQQVIREEKTIIIEPAQPEVVYVPNYNPTVLYGSWPYPSYPPVYLPPPPGYAFGTALVSGLAFGAGVAITAGLWNWASPAWNRGNVNVNVNRYNNINVNRRQINSNVWQANRAGGRPAGLARPPAGPVGRPARAAGLPANAVGRPQVSVPRSAVAPPARSAGAVRQPAAGAAGQARTANRAAGQGGLAANRPAASGARPAGQQQVAANRPQREATNRPQRQGAFSGMNEGRQAGQYYYS